MAKDRSKYNNARLNSPEKLKDFFEKNIKKYCENNVMPSYKTLDELWFYNWYQAVYRKKNSWYKWLKDFALRNGITYIKKQ